jgi:1-acyl-sn-glycerol-3-phosphate acyltransferase
MPGAAVIEWLAQAIAHSFYRVDTVGSVPGQGPLLLLANHPNALLDPAIVIATSGRSVRFIAKSTLFSGPFALLLQASGAIPVFRKQDAGADVKRNRETFAAVDTALTRGDAICIFPEGISHSTGRLEALRTGAARMALSAASHGVPVQLVPIGINPEEKTSFRSRLTVIYGRPFAVGANDDVPTLTAAIAERMRSLIIEADPSADAALVVRIDQLYSSERVTDPDPRAEVERRRTIAAGLERLRAQDPLRYGLALLQLRRYDQRLRRFGLGDRVLDWNTSLDDALRFAAREIPLALLLVPIACASIAAFAVPYALTAAIARFQRDTDVTATAKVVAGAILYPVWISVIAAVAGARFGTPWALAALLTLPALAVAGLFALERQSAVLRTARSWIALRGANPRTRRRLRRHRAELADVLDEIHASLDN